jgi:photosystem II stability/assembly factor-like uncharacterized protein
MIGRYILLVIFLLIAAQGSGRAQALDREERPSTLSPLQEVRWEQPYDLAILYMQMAIDSGGVIYALGDPMLDRATLSREGWSFNRSTDNGTTWSGSNHGLPFLLFALACDAPGSIYAGTTYGLYHSNDSGNHWSHVDSVGWDVMALAAGPGGTLLAGTHNGVIYRSTDKGVTWESDTLDPVAGPLNFVFAGDRSIVLATSSGIHRSTDDGISWNESNDGIDPSDGIAWWSKPAVAAAPWGDLYVSYLATMYRSADNGKSWQKMDQTWPGRIVTAILATAQGEMFIGTGPNGGVLRSTDRGETWEQTAPNLTSIDPLYMPVNVTQMFVTRSGAIIAATDSASIIRTATFDVAGVKGTTAAEEKGAITAAVIPNPAVSTATVQVTVPHAGKLRAELVDSHGETVAVVQDGIVAGGRHSLPLALRELPGGIYFCRLLFDGASVTATPVYVIH